VKHLVVIRHAKAEHPGPGEDDSSRRLTEKGVAAAYRLGRLLAEKKLLPDLVLVSPAIRAKETAEQILSSVTGDFDMETMPLLYSGDERDAFEALENLPDSKHRVFLIGHNPTFTDLINLLCGPAVENMRTGSAGHVVFPVETWAEMVPGEATLDVYLES